MWYKTIKITSLMGFLMALVACSMTGFSQSAKDNAREEKIDVLTEFTLAVNKNEYDRAIEMLTDGERDHIYSAGQFIPETLKRKLDRLKLSTLAKDSRVKLINGKLSGIYDRLEVLELGPPVYHTLLLENQPDQKPLRIAEPPLSPAKLEVKIALEKLVNAVQSKDWKLAMSMIEKSDRDLFFSYQGKMLSDMPDRLERMQLADWQILEVENGKLQGLYHILPEGKAQEEIVINKFIRLVENDQWNKALGMLSRYERNYLCDNKGRIKPHYKLMLKTLTPPEWEELMVHDGRISGILDWMGMGPYGLEKQVGSR